HQRGQRTDRFQTTVGHVAFKVDQPLTDVHAVQVRQAGVIGGAAPQVEQLQVRIGGQTLDQAVFGRADEERHVYVAGLQLACSAGAAVFLPAGRQVLQVDAVHPERRVGH